MGVRTRRTFAPLLVFTLLLALYPMGVAQGEPGSGTANLRVSLPDGTFINSSNPDPWLDEGWLLNLTGAPWAFTVRVTEVSSVHESFDTHLIVALNNASYDKLDDLSSLNINDTTIPKAAFQYGIPEPYKLGWIWPDDVYPTWFNDTYINLETIDPFAYKEVNVSANFSNPTGARMHFDAYGKAVSEIQKVGDIIWTPNSEDSTVVSAGASPGIPQASFNWEPETPYVNNNVTFNATDSTPDGGTIVSYAWDFGDNTTGDGNVTTHTYAEAKNYTVTLNVTDNDGLWDTTSKNITVIDYPVANFTVSPDPPYYAPATLTFNASSSTPNGGEIISYAWDFGDDVTKIYVGANLTEIATHTYTTNGTYTVTLNVTDSEDLWNTTSKDITIFSPVGQHPVANFTVLPPGPPYYPGVELTFNGSEPISYDPDGSIVGWNWTIQNETMAVIANLTGSVVSYNFTATGTYTINLTVTDDDDLTNSTSKVITTEKFPAARFTYSPDKPLVGEPVTFNASDSTPDGGGIVSYAWDFGDSNVTTVTNPIINHTYATYGTYTVTLNVTDSEDLWDTNSTMVKVYAPPKANFTYSASDVIAGEPVTFNASASYDPDGYIVNATFDFGDSTPPVTLNGTETPPWIVNHTYAAYGNYTVTLKVTDNDGLTDTTTLNITVIDYPVANFTVSPLPPYYAPATLTFNASGSTANGGYIVNYTWNFGDLNVTTVDVPIINHTYADAGTYPVTLNVTDSEGLWNTTTTVLTVDRCDVVVTNVVPLFKGIPVNATYKTWTLNVNVTVHNNGTIPINCTVTTYYFNATVTQQIGTSQNITNLPPCNTTTLTFNWDFAGLPVNVTYTVKANATCTCGASDEFINGQVTKRPWGDVNGDGKVGLADVGTLDLIYSGIIKPPYGDLMPDINGDGKVGLADVGTLDLIYSGILTEGDC